jgi:hypothetical protein
MMHPEFIYSGCIILSKSLNHFEAGTRMVVRAFPGADFGIIEVRGAIGVKHLEPLAMLVVEELVFHHLPESLGRARVAALPTQMVRVPETKHAFHLRPPVLAAVHRLSKFFSINATRSETLATERS